MALWNIGLALAVAAEAPSLTLPITVNPHQHLEVTLTAQQAGVILTLPVVLDSGSSYSLILQGRLMDQAGFQEGGATLGWSAQETQEARFVRNRFGPDNPDSFTGMLGWPVMKARCLTVDFKRHQLVVAPPRRAGDVPPSTPERLVIPFLEHEGNAILLPTTINGTVQGYWHVDLGAPYTWLREESAKEAGLVRLGAARGLRWTAILTEASMGDRSVTAYLPRVEVRPDKPTHQQASRGLPQPMLGDLGLTFLRQFQRVTFDGVNQRLILEGPRVPIALAARAIPSLGLTTRETRNNRGLLVATVAPNGPADLAGLQPGDLLLAHESDWIPLGWEEHLREELLQHRRPGDVMTFTFMRNGHLAQILVTVGVSP